MGGLGKTFTVERGFVLLLSRIIFCIVLKSTEMKTQKISSGKSPRNSVL